MGSGVKLIGTSELYRIAPLIQALVLSSSYCKKSTAKEKVPSSATLDSKILNDPVNLLLPR